jgi:hypothetical protein
LWGILLAVLIRNGSVGLIGERIKSWERGVRMGEEFLVDR